LLKVYRRLMHLRANYAALREGGLEPVETGNDALLAYTRKHSTGQVLVVANLGTAPATLALPGRFSYRNLLTPGRTRPSLPTLQPRTAYIYEITQRR
jgi:glycosidase